MHEPFDLSDFLPYLLNQAADASSLEFQGYYRSRYAMLRTEWRVLFHLGRYGPMTARAVCDRARIHKTKVSRAVAALEAKRFVRRRTLEHDRRQEELALTPSGEAAFRDLAAAAQRFDRELLQGFTAEEEATLRRCLARIAGL